MKGELEKRLEKYCGTEAYKEVSKTLNEFWLERMRLTLEMAWVGEQSLLGLWHMAKDTRSKKERKKHESEEKPITFRGHEFNADDMVKAYQELKLKWFGSSKEQEVFKKLFGEDASHKNALS